MAVSSIPSPMRVNSPRFANDQTSLPSPNAYQQVQQTYQQSDQFSFEQTFGGGNGSQPSTPQPGQQSDRSRNNSGMTSEYVRQELRSHISGRTAQHQQSIQSQAPPPPAQSSQQQLSHTLSLSADLDMFSLLSDSNDDFASGLLNMDNSTGIHSPVSHLNLNLNRPAMVSVTTRPTTAHTSLSSMTLYICEKCNELYEH
jgi:hypothetical protein